MPHESALAYAALDDPDVNRTFTRPADESAATATRESLLAIEGMHCASCVRAIDQALRPIDGLVDLEVNLATHRARLLWDPARVRLSTLFEAISAAGYQPFPSEFEGAAALRARARRKAVWRLFVAGFCMMQVMMYSVPTYFAGPGEITPDIEALMRWAGWMLSVPVIVFASGPFFESAARDIAARRIGMDVPVALGIAITFAASTWATFTGEGEVYFDSLTMFVFFLLAGRTLEEFARGKAAGALESLHRRLPESVERLPRWPDARGAEHVAVLRLRAGDVVRVVAGAAVPADGEVLDGASACDEAILTGESAPVAKVAGDALIAGAINLQSPLTMRVARTGAATRFAQIVELMDRAAAERPRLARLADRVARHFLVGILLLALAAGAAWSVIDPHRALWIVVSVLIVTCPCALSLATPAAMLAATGALARRGVLVRRPQALEDLSRATSFVFDKTGTLTRDRLHLARIDVEPGEDAGIALARAASLAAASLHPAARAIAAAAAERGVSAVPAEGLAEVAGAGMRGTVDGVPLLLGSAAFALGRAEAAPAQSLALTLASEGRRLATFVLEETVRDDAGGLVQWLGHEGIGTALLSGDSSEAVACVARQVGIADANGGASPADKLAEIERRQSRGERVAMVGDGLNDGPVLARADVSIAIGSGAPLAQARSDFILLSGRLDDVRFAVQLARRTMRTVRQNLAWAAVYNAVCVPLAVVGWMPPWLAGLGMASSSLLVVLNALRLSRDGD